MSTDTDAGKRGSAHSDALTDIGYHLGEASAAFADALENADDDTRPQLQIWANALLALTDRLGLSDWSRDEKCAQAVDAFAHKYFAAVQPEDVQRVLGKVIQSGARARGQHIGGRRMAEIQASLTDVWADPKVPAISTVLAVAFDAGYAG